MDQDQVKSIPSDYNIAFKKVRAGIISETNLWKYSINNPVGKGMITIFDEIVLINKAIMVTIKFPKSAVYDVEVLIGEVPENLKETTLWWMAESGINSARN